MAPDAPVSAAVEGLGGLGRADVAQGACGGLGRLGVGAAEQFGNRVDGLGVAAHAETADHAQQRPALELAQGVAQGVVHRRIGDGLQGIAGHVRELFIAQQGGQGGDGLLRGDAGKLTAGGRLFLLGCARLEHGDELGLLRDGGGRGGGQQGDGQHEILMVLPHGSEFSL